MRLAHRCHERAELFELSAIVEHACVCDRVPGGTVPERERCRGAKKKGGPCGRPTGGTVPNFCGAVYHTAPRAATSRKRGQNRQAAGAERRPYPVPRRGLLRREASSGPRGRRGAQGATVALEQLLGVRVGGGGIDIDPG